MIITGTTKYRRLEVQADYSELPIMRSLPMRRWDKATDRWLVPAIPANLAVLAHRGCEVPPIPFREIPTELDASFTLKTAPRPYQKGALLAMRDMQAFGLFMDPGTGKTKVLIDDAVAAHARGEIDAVLLLCPNSVKSNWADELAIHSGGAYTTYIHEPGQLPKAVNFVGLHVPALKWLIMGIESMSSASGAKVAEMFLRTHCAEIAVDESSRVKTHDANRTKAIIAVAKLAMRTRIATGTPATKGPQNVWSQMEVLDPQIIDMDYYPFRATFCIMGGYKQKQIVAPKNEDVLLDLFAPYVFQARKSDCLKDLPPKTYQRRFVSPSPEQARLYADLLRTGTLETPNGVMDFDTALVRDLRLHQLTGGFVATQECIQSLSAMLRGASKDAIAAALDTAPSKTWYSANPIPGANPKIEELKRIVEEQAEETKIIIWSRYRPEVEAIAQALAPYGEAVQFHGGVSLGDRAIARQRFQSDPKVKFFVGQIQTGGIGITLTAASVAVFFSSDYSAENRIQAEDRNHRIGSEVHSGCLYIDLLLDGKYMDKNVLDAVQRGVDYHHGMMGDLAIKIEKNSLT